MFKHITNTIITGSISRKPNRRDCSYSSIMTQYNSTVNNNYNIIFGHFKHPVALHTLINSKYDRGRNLQSSPQKPRPTTILKGYPARRRRLRKFVS